MLPPWLEALVLGIVQGLTEFIPVSSSGHLVLIPYLAGWDKPSLAFDVMLHFGTMLAVLVYFRGELVAMVRGVLRLDTSAQGVAYRRIALFIVPASVPIGAVGLLLEEQVSEVFGSPLVVAMLLVVTAVLLLTMEAVRSRRVARAGTTATPPGPGAAARSGPSQEGGEDAESSWTGDWRAGMPIDDGGPAAIAPGTLPLGIDPVDPAGTDLSGLTLRQAMIAGAFQCVAVLPGISRSGATITGGVMAGLTREAATRFSFLLVIPALVGATALSVGDLGEGGETAAEYIVGMVAAAVSGYLAIRFLVALVSRERLNGFAYYCLAAAAVGLIGYAILGPPSTV